MQSRRQAALALLLIAATGLAAVAVTGVVGADSHATDSDGTVSVGTGQQLSTIIATTEDDVRTEFEDGAVEARLEGDDDAREAIDDRVDVLRDRAAEIREEYREATQAYADDEISRSTYAQRLALLNARAENVLRSLNRLQARSANVSGTNGTAALNESTVEDVSDRLDEVSSAGPDALLERFTGQRSGKLEIRVDGGIRIEAESEDGERSREIRRPGDGDDSFTVNQSEALSTARSELSAQDGNWRLTRASIHEDDGEYRFEFVLSAANETGEAEIRVDGSSGDVIRLEEEIERADDEDEREEDEDEREQDDERKDVGEPTLLIANGTPGPNETVTLRVLVDGEPVGNATVTRNDVAVGQTGPDGTIEVTLPPGESEFETQVGDEDAELEFEFEEEREDEGDEDEQEDAKDDEDEREDEKEDEDEDEDEQEDEEDEDEDERDDEDD